MNFGPDDIDTISATRPAMSTLVIAPALPQARLPDAFETHGARALHEHDVAGRHELARELECLVPPSPPTRPRRSRERAGRRRSRRRRPLHRSRDLGMEARRFGSELRHLTEHRDRAASGGGVAQVRERSAHRDGFAFQAVVDQEATAGELALL